MFSLEIKRNIVRHCFYLFFMLKLNIDVISLEIKRNVARNVYYFLCEAKYVRIVSLLYEL